MREQKFPMILRRPKHDGMSSRTRFGRCNGSISCARTIRAQILRSQFPSRRERTRKAAKSSSHFAPKSLSFTHAKESLGGKGKNRSRTSNKNERARTSSRICDARFMLIFIVREKRHKNYSQKRESFARKRSNDVPFCVRLRKMWFLLWRKEREEQRKEEPSDFQINPTP